MLDLIIKTYESAGLAARMTRSGMIQVRADGGKWFATHHISKFAEFEGRAVIW